MTTTVSGNESCTRHCECPKLKSQRWRCRLGFGLWVFFWHLAFVIGHFRGAFCPGNSPLEARQGFAKVECVKTSNESAGRLMLALVAMLGFCALPVFGQASGNIIFGGAGKHRNSGVVTGNLSASE